MGLGIASETRVGCHLMQPALAVGVRLWLGLGLGLG